MIDFEILDRAGLISIEAMIIKALCFARRAPASHVSSSYVGHLRRNKKPGGQRSAT